MTKRCHCIQSDTDYPYGDTHRDEPRLVWTEQYRGNRLTFQQYPFHWARVLVARRTKEQYGNG
jgi:hypothetical protein